MNRWGRTRDEDELPDAVVRMYRESLDEDGLDFLRWGPRTPAEHLAYAQRVHPEAHRRARPAPVSSQTALWRYGTVDGRRHFVGPDRVVYARDENSMEPVHASIRRGYETAVPGFERMGPGELLAQAGSPTPVAPDRMEDDTAGWHPAYRAGPMRMREIEMWSSQAGPEDVGAMEQRDRIDVLRRLRRLDSDQRLSDVQLELGREVGGGLAWDKTLLDEHARRLKQLVQKIADDPTVRDALTRWNDGNRWEGMSTEQRGEVLQTMAKQMAEGLDIAVPTVRYHPFDSELAGRYSTGTKEVEVNSGMTSTGLPEALPVKTMAKLAHEVTHAWQDQLRDRWVSGTLAADDPDYRLGELAALAYPFFVPFGSVPQDRYSGQVLESWSRVPESLFFGEVWNRRPPVLDRAPPGYGLP